MFDIVKWAATVQNTKTTIKTPFGFSVKGLEGRPVDPTSADSLAELVLSQTEDAVKISFPKATDNNGNKPQTSGTNTRERTALLILQQEETVPETPKAEKPAKKSRKTENTVNERNGVDAVLNGIG
jgi:hypothetical protein